MTDDPDYFVEGEDGVAAEADSSDGVQTAEIRYAGFWLRFFANLIDTVILGFIAVIVSFMGGAILTLGTQQGWSRGQQSIGAYAIKGVIAVIAWMYFALAESSDQGATPGKLAMSLRVTDLDGNRVSFDQASRRFFAKNLAAWVWFACFFLASVIPIGGPGIMALGSLLSGLLYIVGYGMAAFTPRKQALHDLLARCLVVRKRRAIEPVHWENLDGI